MQHKIASALAQRTSSPSEPSVHSLQYSWLRPGSRDFNLLTACFGKLRNSWKSLKGIVCLFSPLPLGIPNQYQRKEVAAQFFYGFLRDESGGSSIVFKLSLSSHVFLADIFGNESWGESSVCQRPHN